MSEPWEQFLRPSELQPSTAKKSGLNDYLDGLDRIDESVAKRLPPPAHVARSNEMARTFNLPPTVTDSTLPDLEKQHELNQIRDLGNQHPAIGRFATDPRNLAVMADDYSALNPLAKSMMERDAYWKVRNVQGSISSLPKPQPSLSNIATGLKESLKVGASAVNSMISDWVTPLFLNKRDATFAAERSRLATEDALHRQSDTNPEFKSSTASGLYSGASSFAMMLPGIAASVVARNPAPAVASAALLTQTQAYAKYRARGGTRGEALAGSTGEGLIEAAGEMLPMGVIVNRFGAGPVKKWIGEYLVKEGLTEQAQQHAQDAVDTAIANPNKTWGEYLSERPDTAYQTALATLVGSAAIGTLSEGSRHLVGQRDSAENAKADAVHINNIMDAASKSKLRERDKPAFQGLIDEMVKDTGSDTMYIDPKAMQSYMQMDGYDGSFDSYSDAISEGLATGGDVVIPLSEAVTKFAGTPAWAAIKDDVRMTPGGQSLREAQTFDEAMSDHMAQIADKFAAQDEKFRKEMEPRDRLMQSIADKLMNAGFTPTNARSQAELLTQRAATRSARTGQELTGGEFDGVAVNQVLPERLAQAQKADGLDMAINVMRKNVTQKDMRGPSLLDFIASKGGVEDKGGDIRSMGGDKWHVGKPGKKRLIRDTSGKGQMGMLGADGTATGYGLDDLAHRAWEAGYFPEHVDRPTTNDLLEAIGEGIAGRERHTQAQDKSLRDAAEELRALLESRGIDADKATTKEIRAEVERYASEQAQGVGYDQSKPVASITGDEIAPIGTEAKALRHAAREWYKSHLSGTKVHSDALNADVEFAGSGKKPISASADARKLRLFVALPEIVANGEVIDSEPDRRATASVKAWHYIRAAVNIAGEMVDVTLSVREDNNGHFYYNHVVENSAPSELTGPAREAGGGTEGSAYDQSIPENSDGININVTSFNDGPRGRITFPASGYGTGPSVIDLFQSRDQSTFLHETGHLWLEELRYDALGSHATDQLKADWQAVQDWFASQGHPLVDGVIPTDAHEMWARGVERYLMEGKAPVPALRKIFQDFKAWLIQIYRSVDRLNSPISDEIRGVMDRLIATDEEIAQAAELQHLEAGFTEKPATMTEGEWGEYQKLVGDAKGDAHDALLAKTMNAIRRRVTKEYKERAETVRAEVSESINNRPEFRALRLLKDTPLDAVALRDEYGEDVGSLLPRQVPPVLKDGGANADEVAELSGFKSGDEMVRTLMGVETRRRELKEGGDKRSVRVALIEQEVDARMMERYGDPFADGSIEEEALAAVHNEKQGEVLAAELRVLSRSTGDSPTPYRVAKAWAERTVREGIVKDVVSRSAIRRYQRAASKAGKASTEAILKGDHAEAFKQKQAQMLNNALISEANKVSDEVEKAQARLEKWAKRKTIKSVDQDYLERAQALLEQVDLRPRSQTSLDKQAQFEAWAGEQEALGHDIVVPASFAATLGTTHWSRLSVETFLGLDAAVDQIIHLGRLKQTLIDNKEVRDYEEARAEMLGSIGKLPPIPPTGNLEPGSWGKLKMLGLAAHASMTKMGRMLYVLDGNSTVGPFNRLIWHPLAHALERQNDIHNEIQANTIASLDAVPDAIKRRFADHVDIPEMPGHDGSTIWSRMQLHQMARNAGTEENWRVLTEGFGWNADAAFAALDREMTKEEWEYVQRDLVQVGSFWPEIEAMYKRINGVAPPKVEVRPIVTRHGTFEGGYYPLVPDSTKNPQLDRKLQSDDLFNALFTRAVTRNGFTNERSGATYYVSLAPGISQRHMMEVVHDFTHREAVMQADKILSDPKIVEAIRGTLGLEMQKQFRPWLKAIANEFASDKTGAEGMDHIANKMRTSMSMMGMGYRIGTMVKQLAGYANSVSELGSDGERWFASGMRSVAGMGPVAATNFAMEKSGVIRHRMMNVDLTQAQELAKLEGKYGLAADVRRFAFYGIGIMDRAVVIPTWHAGYNKGIAQGMSEEDASALGDYVVNASQGGAGIMNASALQRVNGMPSLLVMFYSYGSAYYNSQSQLARDIGTAVRERKVADVPRLMARAWWLMLAPNLMSTALGALVGGGPDDDESWVKYLAIGSVAGIFTGVPVVGSWVQSGLSGFDFSASPLDRAGTTIWNSGKDVWHSIDDYLPEGVPGADPYDETHASKRAVRNTVESVGYVTHLPLGQPAPAVQFITDWANNKQNPETLHDWYEGLTKGKISD